MEPKNSKIFSREIMKTVSEYCESENIKDVDHFMFLCFKQGFDIKRYGLLGETLNEGEKHLNIEDNDENSGKMGGIQEKPVEIEVIREKLVEIPVEVIREVEKIVEIVKEIPVDRIVEKEVFITDDKQVNELLLKIQQLELEKQLFSTKTQELEEQVKKFSTMMVEMESIFQKEMFKKEQDLDELRRSLDIPKENDKTKLLQDTLQKLRKEISEKNTKIEELEKMNSNKNINTEPQRAIFLKGSNLTQKM